MSQPAECGTAVVIGASMAVRGGSSAARQLEALTVKTRNSSKAAVRSGGLAG